MSLPIIALLAITIIALVVLGVVVEVDTAVPVNVEVEPEDTSIDVIVVGVPSSDVVKVLSSSEAQAEDIHYPINLDPSFVTLKMLQEYDVVIIQGDPYFDMIVREAIGDYVNEGGSLVAVGDAGSKHPEYSNVAGWAWPSGQGIPVPAQLIGQWSGYSDVASGSALRLTDVNHPIVKGMKIKGSKLEAPSQIFKVTSEGEVIVAIDTDEGTLPAVIEGSSGTGKVVYFSFDPGQTPSLLLNTIRYLA